MIFINFTMIVRMFHLQKKYIVKLPLSKWNKKSNIFMFCQKYDCFIIFCFILK